MTFFSPLPCFSTTASTLLPLSSGEPTLMVVAVAEEQHFAEFDRRARLGVEFLDLAGRCPFRPDTVCRPWR